MHFHTKYYCRISGIFGFGGSALSQISSGKKFSFKKALGSAANGAVIGAVRGAMVGSGAGVAATLASNFAAGAAGNALEQRIGRGKVNIRESVTSGLTNAVSGAIYGNHPLKSAKDALVRGAGAGAATAAINHLSNAWDSRRNTRQDNSWNPGSMADGAGISPYMTKRDPKAGCVTASPVKSSIGYSGGYRYQYKTPGGSQKGRNNNSIVSFGKDVLIGAVMGGLSSVSFYGADKAPGSLKRSIRGDKGGSNGEVRYREGRPVSPVDRTYEMALNPEYYAEEAAKKYGINLRGSGQQVNITYDPNHLKGPGLSKQLDSTNIILGPQAFISEEELARTIAHELNHAGSWLQGGLAPEETARFAENALGNFIRVGKCKKK